MANPEALFQQRVLRKLRSIDGMFVFTKEAKSLRGLPDLIGCYRGKFFGWELKASAQAARRKTGRIVLQRHILSQIQSAEGIGELVHPDNFEQKLAELIRSVPK